MLCELDYENECVQDQNRLLQQFVYILTRHSDMEVETMKLRMGMGWGWGWRSDGDGNGGGGGGGDGDGRLLKASGTFSQSLSTLHHLILYKFFVSLLRALQVLQFALLDISLRRF